MMEGVAFLMLLTTIAATLAAAQLAGKARWWKNLHSITIDERDASRHALKVMTETKNQLLSEIERLTAAKGNPLKPARTRRSPRGKTVRT